MNHPLSKMYCIFLGYNNEETCLIRFFKKKNIYVKNIKKKELSYSEAKKADIIISFGYRKFIKKKIVEAAKRPILKLHMSYLPYNRGAHPSFCSIINDNPIGISIFEINTGSDTGRILLRKKFNLNFKSKKFSTFKKVYNYLFHELEDLFIEKFELIINGYYSTVEQYGGGSHHRIRDLPDASMNWNTNIVKYKKNYFKSFK